MPEKVAQIFYFASKKNNKNFSGALLKFNNKGINTRGTQTNIFQEEINMSDLIQRKETTNMPSHSGYRKEFHDLVNSFFNGFWDASASGEMHALKHLEPKVEVLDNKDDVTVYAEVPGISEKDLDLEVSADGYMTLSGEKKSTKQENGKNSCFSEISYGSFKRTIPLPWDLKYDAAKADFENGMIKVYIPKLNEDQCRKKKLAITKII